MEKKSEMSTAIDWSKKIELIGGAYAGNRKSWLARAAARAGISFRQAKGLYYRECVDPRHTVATRVLTAAEQAQIQEAKKDALLVADFFDRHAATLTSVDENFYRPEIDAFVEAARVLSGRNRT